MPKRHAPPGAAEKQARTSTLPVEKRLRARVEALELAVRARDEFLAIAAHELRSPLNALALRLAYVEKLAEREQASAQLLQEIRRTRDSADRYARRAAVLLDVARLNEGRLDVVRHPIDIPALVRDVVDAHRQEASMRGASLESHVDLDAAATGHWDEHMIEQVLSNLVHNAIKYGEGSPVRLHAYLDGSDAVFEVTDEGPGIPDADRARIFAKFERLMNTASRHRGGYGLGLWIVRSMVEAHGGQIALESLQPRGTLFRVRLPLGAADKE